MNIEVLLNNREVLDAIYRMLEINVWLTFVCTSLTAITFVLYLTTLGVRGNRND